MINWNDGMLSIMDWFDALEALRLGFAFEDFEDSPKKLLLYTAVATPIRQMVTSAILL
jgi:hypothetical protein